MAYDFSKLRNPVIRDLAEEIFSVVDGHDHDGANSKAVTAGGTVADGSVTLAKCDAGVQASLELADTAVQPDDVLTPNIPEGTPTNAAAAAIVMTIDGVAIDGETVTIGDEVYEFCADADSTVTGDNIPVDIEDYTVKGSVILTLDTAPALGDTFTLGTKVYIVVPTASANGDGDVAIGDGVPAFKANVVAAINGTDNHNVQHPLVTCAAFDGDDAVITAIAGGVAGNVDSTDTFTTGNNAFATATLINGDDCAKADAKTALVAAIDTESAIVGAAATAGDTLTITAKATGTAGNVDISKTMANGTFAGAATKLAGGTDGTLGTKGDMMRDVTYLYVCIADNSVTGTNWRRVALGSAY
ncbi:MAG: hypothetical protein WC262_09045 [Bacteroidales bacterium]|jgi:sorbitol-specific phosphotransferase system component IIA